MARTLAHFFLIGGGLLALRAGASSLLPEPARPLVVAVDAAATDAEVEGEVERAVLVAEAERRGWLETDPVIRGRLVRNLRFVRGDAERSADLPPAEEERLLGEAIALGMHESDPVVRGRLEQRADRMARAAAGSPPPPDEELLALVEASPERFERPGRYRLGQVFLSRAERGGRLEAEARDLGARLQEGGLPPAEAERLGDPLPFSFSGRLVSAELLDGRLGRGFGDAVAGAPLEVWVGPIPSSYGLHFVYVEEAEPGGVPPLAEIRERAAALVIEARVPRERAALVAEMRRGYAVRVVRRGGRG